MLHQPLTKQQGKSGITVGIGRAARLLHSDLCRCRVARAALKYSLGIKLRQLLADPGIGHEPQAFHKRCRCGGEVASQFLMPCQQEPPFKPKRFSA